MVLPPRIDDHQPSARLSVPPLTEDSKPPAVFERPPVTADDAPVAVHIGHVHDRIRDHGAVGRAPGPRAGHVPDRADRERRRTRVRGRGYLLTSAVNLVRVGFLDWNFFFPGPDAPNSLLTIRADADLALTIREITDIATFTWLAAPVLLIAHRVLRASPPTRRAFAAVWLTAVAFRGCSSRSSAPGWGWLLSGEAYGTWLEVMVATVPVVLAATLILTHWRRTGS